MVSLPRAAFWLDVKPRKLVSLPYGHDMGDKTAVGQLAPPEFFTKMLIDTFNVLYRESADNGAVMPLSLHPYITGVPHRIGYLEKLYEYILQRPGVKMWTGEQILDWYRHAAKP